MPPDLLPDVALDVVVPAGTLGFGPSFLVVYAAGLIVPATLLWLALAQLARHLAWARRARELQVLKRLPEAAPGREEQLVVARGVVEPAPDADHGAEPDAAVVRVTIEQSNGLALGRNGPANRWTETSREVTAKPFYLTLASGERMRVVPDQHVIPAELRARAEPIGPGERRRLAEVHAGDEVFVTGVLRREPDPTAETGGYRGGGTAPVLRRAHRQRMLISTDLPERRFLQAAGFYGYVAVALTLAILMVQGALFLRFNLLHATGEPVIAEVVDLLHRAPSQTAKVYARFWDRAAAATIHLDDRVDLATYAVLDAKGAGAPVPFLLSPRNPELYQLGTEPRLHIWKATALLGLWIGGLLLYRKIARRKLPWYTQRRLIERDGPGRA